MIPSSRVGAVVLLLAAMAFGALVGGIAVSAAERRGMAPGGRPAHGRDAYIARMTEELGLSAPQQDSIRAVLDRHRPTMDSMWQEVRPRFDSARAVIRGEIRVLLTPDQQQKYQQLLERREKERNAQLHE